MFVFGALLSSSQVAIAEEYFNPALLLNTEGGAVANLSQFEQGFQPPGKYTVDFYVNDRFSGSKELSFNQLDQANPVSGGLVPCLDRDLLLSSGINVYEILPEDQHAAATCIDLRKYITEARMDFNFSQHRVDLVVPQIWIKQEALGYIPPSQWQEGITAATLNYNLNGSSSNNRDNFFASFNTGMNIKGFRYRNFSTFNYTNNKSTKQSNSEWNNVQNYIEKSIVPIKSELIMGDNSTNGSIFDGVGFRGIRLYSSDAMLPNTMQGYAPVVRGVANNKGKVVVRQNGYIVYQTQVTPGPFEIKDLLPMNLSGDLNVTVEDELGGEAQNFTVPYSGVAMLLREGRTKFDLTVGEFRSGSDDQDKPWFLEGTLSRGLGSGVTLYGGTQLAENYQSLALGVGKNMGQLGAFSVDLIHANSRLANDKDYSGQSYRFLFSKSLNNIGTNLQLLGYRYTTKGFYTLSDTAYKTMERLEPEMQYDQFGNAYIDNSSYYNLNYAKKGHFQANLSQHFDKYGSIYATANYQSYWNTAKSTKNYQVGYSNNNRYFGYNISWNLVDSSTFSDEKNNTISASISMPMSAFFGRKVGGAKEVYSNSSYVHNDKGGSAYSTSLNGQLLEDSQLSYSMSIGHNEETGSFGGGAMSLATRYGTGGISYDFAEGGDSSSFGYSMMGSMILHRNGLTLGQSLGDTNILIDANGAKDVKVENSRNIKTDSRGYAIVPYAENYRVNRVALVADSLDDRTEILTSALNVVPMRGALIKANFDSRIGHRALIKFTRGDGLVPYGSTVNEQNQKVSSLVGANGQTFLSGLADQGVLDVRWGEGEGESCQANYDLKEVDLSQPMIQLSLVCHPVGAMQPKNPMNNN